MASGLEDVRTALAAANANQAQGPGLRRPTWTIARPISCSRPKSTAPHRRLSQRRPVRVADIADVPIRSRTSTPPGMANGKPAVLLIIFRQPGANIIDTVDRIYALLPQLQNRDPAGHRPGRGHGPHDHHPRLGFTT
jgi:multidrug efflux pump